MFEGYKVKEFEFHERKAVIIFPNCTVNGKMVLKTEYLEAFPGFDIAMLERGYYVIHIYHRNRWATDDENEIMADFVKFCAKELGADEKCILEGLSCGGLQAAKMAEEHPELVSVLYLDAPVLNILSLAGLGVCENEAVEIFWSEISKVYNLNKSTIVNFRKSPIDNMEPLIKNNIPVIMLYGDADDVVIYEENGRVLENYYKENGGNMEIIVRHGGGHHPHGLDDPTPIIKFIEKHI